MDAINEQLKKPVVVGIIAFVLGLFIGLVVLGWNLWPVKYVDASPQHLVYSAKVDYLRTSIEAYGTNQDAVKAKERYEMLGEGNEKVLAEISANPGDLPPALVQSFAMAVAGPVLPGATPVAKPTEAAAKSGGLSTLVVVLCVVVLVIIAGAAAFFFLFRGKPMTSGPGAAPSTTTAKPEAARQAAWTDYAATTGQAPVGQFMSSYKIGDDLYDESFSIDSPSGEFMGECGIGISETIGVGEPKKVTALEVWVFDKNDIQTVTKVFMSNYAFNDGTIKQRLSAKGEPVLAIPGAEAELETQTLRMVARIVEMSYSEGPLPPESFFDRFVIELAVWPKGSVA